jgi:undecaprenyl-diphosphatase
MLSAAPLDEPIVRFLNHFAQVNPAFDRLVVDIADSALLKGGFFMAYFWWLWFKGGKDAASRQNAIVVSFAGALFAVAISRILQRLLPFHDRLVHAAATGFVLPAGVDPKSLSDWSSFPSDHAALFFALSTAILFQSRRSGFLAALWTTFVICLPRIYLGFHYPSDIIAGAVLGVAIMAGTHFWADSARWPARIVDWSRAHQTAFYALAFLATYEMTVLFYDLRALAEDGFHVLRSVMVASA